MTEYTWDEFYEKFFDWSLKTQKQKAKVLNDFGDQEEVFEVIMEFIFYDESFAADFTRRAFEHGVRFTAENVAELACYFDESLLSLLAKNATTKFSKDELETVYGLIDEETFGIISKKANINIFEEDEIGEVEDIPPIEFHYEKPKRLGFFESLFALFIGNEIVNRMSEKPKLSHKCNGDCAHCPPHYGYRYGRWYYGHDHQHGCEFGGNKGSGGMN